MRFLALLVCLCALSAPAHAWSALERMNAATKLGSVLGSEDLCGLTFNQDAISAYIDKTVPADDMEFASMLSMMTDGTSFQLKDMTPSQKTAHCRQTERVAKAFGFIP